MLIIFLIKQYISTYFNHCAAFRAATFNESYLLIFPSWFPRSSFEIHGKELPYGCLPGQEQLVTRALPVLLHHGSGASEGLDSIMGWSCKLSRAL